MSVALKRDERWAVIVAGVRVDVYAPPEMYPEFTQLRQVMSQPFVARIRRFCAKRGDGGWDVKIKHRPECMSVLCTCRPALHFEKVA